MTTANYPIVTESRPGTYSSSHFKVVAEHWPDSPLDEVIADLLDTVEVGSEVMLNRVGHTAVYYRQRRLGRAEVAGQLLEAVEEFADGGGWAVLIETAENLGLLDSKDGS